MRKYICFLGLCCIIGAICSTVEAKVTFLPDWMASEMDFNFGDDPSQDENFCIESGLYHEADGCPEPQIFDEYCPFDDDWISDCYCPSHFDKICQLPYRGDARKKINEYSNCGGKWVACCDTTCPHGTSVNNAEGCDGYELNACGDKCFYPYRAPLADEQNCKYGTEKCSDNCGGVRLCCKSCTPGSDVDVDTCEYGTKTCIDECGNSYTCCNTCTKGVNVDPSTCENGTTTCTDECGDTYTCCNTCKPKTNDTGCQFGTGSCDDGCGGTRTCCCDENDRSCACPGYVWCDPATKVGDGATCSDGSKTYYERCLVKETCNDDNHDETNGYCVASKYTSYASSGYYYVKDKCTTQTGTVIKYWGSCTGSSSNSYKDCAGNTVPCKDMKTCDDDQGIGEACECGGKKYFKECEKNTCNTDTMYLKGNSMSDGFCWATTLASFKDSGGWYYVKDKCTKPDGTLVFGYRSCTDTSKDCNGNTPPCAGKKSCPNDEGTGLCECGGKKYFDTCTETCNGNCKNFEVAPNHSVCYSAKEEDSSSFSSGYYKSSLKCTKKDGTKMYFAVSCNTDKKDTTGNYAPCKGMQTCDSKYIGIGKECSCGGKIYYEACAFICNYEDTEESCKTLGKEFEQKCYGVNSSKDQKWYGVCK